MLLLKIVSYKGKKIVYGIRGIIGNIAFFYVVFVAVVEMLRESFDFLPFTVRGIIMPVNKSSYMPLLPVIRVFSSPC